MTTRSYSRLLALLLALGPVLWGGAQVPATAAESAGSLLVIMDVSGSMERKDDSGTTLIAGARQAVREFVETVPGDTPIGLRLYGSEYPGDDKRRGCRDTRLSVPIAPASSSGARITEAIDRAKPTGFTPIGYSLTQAAKDFGPEGQRSIVLVSDGEDTCGNPAPCVAARNLAEDGIDVRVDTVGLFLADNPKARKQLECVARATGGTYVPADDAQDLATQLTAVSERAVQRFQAAGTEVDGGPAQPEATAIEPGTDYVDDIVNGESRWYSFEATEGQRIEAVLTDDGTAPYGCCMKLRVVDSEGDRVDADSGYSSGSANTYQAETYDDGARSSGTFYLQVQLDDTTGDDPYGAVEYQLRVDVEDQAASASASPTAGGTASESPTPTTETSPAAAEGDSDDDTLLWVVIGVLMLVVLALVGALAALWRRTRSGSRTG